MSDKTTEAVEQEIEIVQPKQLDMNQAKFDAMIRFADQSDKIGRALDTTRAFVMKRALPGDWVQHGDNINLSGPGAERVLSALASLPFGITASFTNWRYWKDTGTDKLGDWFVWWYEADVEIGALRFEKVQGRAGSRDKFFGYANSAWKDLSDVKETDIRMAARRGVIKDGIKLAMGLRSIPYESAAALGLDLKVIKKVEYGGGGSTTAAAAPSALGTPLLVKNVIERSINKKDGTKTIVYVIEDERGTKYETFSESLANAAKDLKDAKKKALFAFSPAANPKFAPKLNSLSEANESQPDPEPQDQEPQG